MLTNVSTDYLESAQPIENAQKLSCRPSTRLGSAGGLTRQHQISTGAANPLLTRREGRVQDVNVNRDVDLAVTNPRLQTINDTVYADLIDLPGLDHIETAFDIIADISLGSHHWSSNACMNRGVADQTLFMRYVKEGSMIDSLHPSSSVIFHLI